MDDTQHRLVAQYAPVARQLDPDARLTGVRRLAGGMSAQITVLELTRPAASDETVVVREYGAKNIAADARPAGTEIRLLSLLRDAGIPVPEPRLADDTSGLLEGPYAVIGFVDGTGPAASWSESLADQLVEVLIRLHRLEVTPVQGWLRPYRSRLERWLSRPPPNRTSRCARPGSGTCSAAGGAGGPNCRPGSCTATTGRATPCGPTAG